MSKNSDLNSTECNSNCYNSALENIKATNRITKRHYWEVFRTASPKQAMSLADCDTVSTCYQELCLCCFVASISQQ